MSLIQHSQSLAPLFHLPRIKQARAEKSLSEFVRQAWVILEPETKYIHGKHIDAICDHLEAVTAGKIRNLIVNIPPRFAKSLLVSVFWPVWVWINFPEKRWLYSSYAEKLAVRDSLKCRRVIQSNWYQERWGSRFQLRTDQNTANRFENTKTGYRICTSVGGSATGEGGDVVVCDDPHSVSEASSVTMLATTLTWWDETMSSRINDPATGSKVIIMQRVAENDLSAHVIRKGNYVHLNLPMEFEKERTCVTALPWKDWRETEGELLWPERFNSQSVQQLKKDLGSFGAAGQLQQRPAPRGGGMFKRHWFEIVREAPANIRLVRFWDMAATKPKSTNQDPDWTVGAKLGLVPEGIWYLLDIRRIRDTPLNVERLIKQTADMDGQIPIYMEQEPGSAGVNVIDHYARIVLVGCNFRGLRSTGPKEVRADPVASAAEAQNFKIVKGEWNLEFLDEMESFGPGCAHDDQVDAVSGAFERLRNDAGTGIGASDLTVGQATRSFTPRRLGF